MNKERFEDIVVLRSAFTILVVFVHSFYVYNYGLLVDVESSFLSVERTVTSEFINKFMMPMFIFISGYLFSYLHYKKHRYSKFIDLFRNKFKRLVLPYCVFLPITALSWGKLKLSVDILLFPMGHLWFLLMLFWCFVITKIILEMHLDKSKVSMFFLLLLFYSLSFFSGYVKNILGLADFVRDYIFFFLGFIINKFDNSVIKDTTTKKCFYL